MVAGIGYLVTPVILSKKQPAAIKGEFPGGYRFSTLFSQGLDTEFKKRRHSFERMKANRCEETGEGLAQRE